MTVRAASEAQAAPEEMRPAGGASLVARGIVKRFGPVVAVDHADFEIGPGVHALLGENGAGKSTLVKIIYGYEQPDEGEIVLDGARVEIKNPADARRLGIGLVFQNFTLIPALTVTENMALFLPDLPRVLDHDDVAARIRETSQRYGLTIDPARRVGTLSLPEQQRVEILRVLSSRGRGSSFSTSRRARCRRRRSTRCSRCSGGCATTATRSS